MSARSHFRFSSVAAAVLSTAMAGGAENWPQFRGTAANGESAAAGLPVEFGENKNILWKTSIPGKAWSSPVIWGGRIWVSTATKDGHELGVACVEAETGKIIHQTTVFKLAEPQFCHPMNSYATPTRVHRPSWQKAGCS